MRLKALIPYALVGFRLALAPCFWVAWYFGAGGRVYVALLAAGLVSDIYDGVLARRWGTSTPGLRRFDSNTDTLFWGCAGTVAVLLHGDQVRPWFAGIAVMFALLLAQNLVNGLRYRSQPSYHFYSGKAWSIALLFALGGLFAGTTPALALDAVVVLSIVNSAEGIIASLVLPRPMTDIPTVFHALRLARRPATP